MGGICFVGYYCFIGIITFIFCGVGVFSNVIGLFICYQCLAGYYCFLGVDNYQVIFCDLGYYCLAGIILVIQYFCLVGIFYNLIMVIILFDCLFCLGGGYCVIFGFSSFIGKCSLGMRRNIFVRILLKKKIKFIDFLKIK